MPQKTANFPACTGCITLDPSVIERDPISVNWLYWSQFSSAMNRRDLQFPRRVVDPISVIPAHFLFGIPSALFKLLPSGVSGVGDYSFRIVSWYKIR